MGKEEAAYWLGMAMHRKKQAASRAVRVTHFTDLFKTSPCAQQ
jgi:hypothetical protein